MMLNTAGFLTKTLLIDFIDLNSTYVLTRREKQTTNIEINL